MIKKTWIAVAMLAAGSTAQAGVVLTEGFDDITTLAAAGWTFVNNSSPLGDTGYFQGNPAVFGSQSGADNSYIAANFLNAAPGGKISNWLISPTFNLFDGETLSFFTRGELAPLFADSLEIRFSTNGASANVGTTADSVGDFTNLITTINPNLDPAGYPSDWTMFNAVFSGIASGGVMGRFAFRYTVPDTNIAGNYIGIDTLTLTVPEPSSIALFGFALALLGYAARRRTSTAL